MSDLLPLPLPTGYRSRPATIADVDAIHRLVATCERALYGRAEVDPDGVAADLARPGLDLALDTLLVHDPAGELAGRAWVNRRSEVDVHPDHQGRGLGGSLLAWVEARAREAGGERIVQTVPDGDRRAVALLRSHGYEPHAIAWFLEIALPVEPVVPEPPAGITVRPFRAGDERAAYQLTEDAFDEWQQRRKSYEEWALLTVERDIFAPAVSSVAFAGDQMVGAVLSLDLPDTDEGYIERVAVRRDHRNQGIARVLLRHTFRDVHRQGRRTCTLWTHSQTGALSLYERVGMTVRHSSTVFGKALTTR
ncbi:GNAT family N-acetyltransferase [Kitasatospora sp. NBC_01266]|uniref:GNAT family N-acetyltransferase n=1 Tax=Kitasatospora sp. NBC_01266 TaxID=2903572 RepID=UPI002E2F64F5|nr:GNAT family N-acetyltransferase [Kitasatospora sp. NBC_01266]